MRDRMEAWVAHQDGLRGRVDVWTELADPTAPIAVRRAATRAIAPDEPHTLVQAALVRALGRIGDRGANAALRSLRAASPETELVTAIDAVLADFES